MLWRGVLRFGLALGFVVLLGSYLGALHPLGDSLAVFRIWLAGGIGALAVLAAASRLAIWARIGGLAAAYAGGPILWMLVMTGQGALPEGDMLRLYTKNTIGGWGDDAAMVADMLSTGADVILLQELSTTRSDFGAALQATHPHQHFCRFSDYTGMAVISRWPLTDPYCSPERSFAAARVEAPFGPVWAVSTHLLWPYPYAQRATLDLALPFLSELEGRVVIAGDFNMVPWGSTVRDVTSATGTEVVSPLFTTLRASGVPLQIDHVLANGTAFVERRPHFGADHLGLLGTIVWAPNAALTRGVKN